MTAFVHLLLQLPLYLLAALAWLCVRAWRDRSVGGHRHRWRYPLSVALVALYIVSAPAMANAVLGWLEAQTSVPTDAELARRGVARDPAILVLAGGWTRATPQGPVIMMGSATWERTWAAIRLWQRVGGTLYLSGAPLDGGSDSVARHMADFARAAGVPADRIKTEDRSTTTWENLEFSERKFHLRARGPLVLVTSALHMPRALALAQRMGLDAVAYPCDFRADAVAGVWHYLPNNAGAEAFEEVMHEVLGFVRYRLRSLPQAPGRSVGAVN